ncbi:MAG TPA: Lrp/AsnC family transcriptional regulator, partial [Lentzea sp.]
MPLVSLDDLDRAVLHALHLDGRVQFNHVAAVLGTSPQTVARRYRKLKETGALRVVGMIDARKVGQVEWFLRLGCTPDAAMKVAQALAQRKDTSWVQLTSGGTEISCVIRAANAPEALLLHQLPKTPKVVSVSAHCLLRSFVGGLVGWAGRADVLTEAQKAELTPSFEHTEPEMDERLVAALHQDGRASFADLATATGWSEPTVRRRVNGLRAAGVLYFDVDVDSAALGFTAMAVLWMSVRPNR